METFYIKQPVARGTPKVDKIEVFANLIPIGRENAISRNALTQLCIANGLIEEKGSNKDRAMRKLLSRVRIDYTILNHSDGKGYYRPSKDDLMDLQRYIRQEESRAKATFKNLSMAKKLYEDYKAGRLNE